MCFYVFIILSLIQQCKLQSNSGIKVQITEAGLNYVASIGMDLLEKEIRSASIPDQDKVTNIKITSFVKPSATITINPGQGMTATISNAQIDADFDWHHKIGKGWLSVSDSGSGNAKSNSISISVGLAFGTNEVHKPTAQLISCSASISGFKFSMHNFLYDTLIQLLTLVFNVNVPRLLENELCKALTKQVDESLNPQLSTLETIAKIDAEIWLSYALSENPIYNAQYIETAHEGIFGSSNFHYISPSNQAMNLAVPSKMVSLALSENLFNSGGYILQNLQRLDRKETLDNPQVTALFNLSPGPLVIELKTLTPPIVSINENGLSFTASTTVAVTSSAIELIYAEVTVILVGDVYIDGGLIKGRIDSLDGNFDKLRVKESKAIEPSLFRGILGGFFEKLKPSINGRGAEGFPLPKLDHIILLDPTIQRFPGFILVSTSFNYTP